MTGDSNSQSASWLAGAGALLSVAACYGTLGLVALLSALGVSLAVNEHIWAGAIVAFALLAVLGVLLGARGHGKAGPVVLAAVGAAAVAWAMYGAGTISAMLGVPSFVVELAGFASLIGAAIWDWRLRCGAG